MTSGSRSLFFSSSSTARTDGSPAPSLPSARTIAARTGM
jgi:hypothetical protein